MENNIKTCVEEERGPKWKCTCKEFIIILCIVVASISSMYCFDLPGSLQEALMKNFHLSSSEFSLFYSLYSVPSVFSSILGGYLIDGVLGLQKSTVIFSTLCVLGAYLFAIGGNVDAFWLMALGRFVYGSGQDTSFGVCVTNYIFLWFKDSYTNLVFSLSDNFGYVGTILVYQLSNRMYELFGEYYPSKNALGFVLIINSSSVVIAFIVYTTMTFIKKDDKLSSVSTENEQNKDKGGFVNFLKFPLVFWLLCMFFSTILTSTYVFGQYSQNMFNKEFGMTIAEASDAMTVMNLCKIALSIPFSLTVDNIGRNMIFIIFSAIIGLISHTAIILKFNPYYCMAGLGASYSLAASTIWPMFLYPLDKSHYGLGYGVTMSFLNLTSIVYTTLAGNIIDRYGYFWVKIYYITVLSVGLLVALVTFVLDKKGTGILNMTPQQRRFYEKNKCQSSEQLAVPADDPRY